VPCARRRRSAAHFADKPLELARSWDTPAARGLALSAKGLASQGEERIDLLTEGAALLGQSPARLDAARAHVDLGAALRRDGRPAHAREPLRLGLEAARACGATALMRPGARGARHCGREAPPPPVQRSRVADRQRAARREARRRRRFESRNSGRLAHRGAGRREPPQPRVPQARHRLARRAVRGPRRTRGGRRDRSLDPMTD
jgi:hypothetical protein